MSPWLLLAFSIIAEVAGTVMLKFSNGFSKILPTVAMGLCYLAAIWLMGLVTKKIEIGITYAIWAGAGTAVTALMGVFLFSESFSTMKVVGVLCIVMGVVFLNLAQNNV